MQQHIRNLFQIHNVLSVRQCGSNNISNRNPRSKRRDDTYFSVITILRTDLTSIADWLAKNVSMAGKARRYREPIIE